MKQQQASTTSQPLASEFLNNLDEVIKLFYSKPSDGLAIEVT